MEEELTTWEILVIIIQKHCVRVLAGLDCGRNGTGMCSTPDLFLITAAISFTLFLKGYISFLQEAKGTHTRKEGLHAET